MRQVLTRVQLGEADAGIVYQTDAQAAGRGTGAAVTGVQTLAIPTAYNVIAVYYIGPVKGAAHPAPAAAWIAYIRSAAGQAVQAKYGFSPPAGAP